MRVPEALFVFINPMMRLLLSSPAHFIASRSLLLIRYRGRRSGRFRTTPLRYVRDGDTIRCFSSGQTSWWRNLRGGADVTLTVRGRRLECRADVVTDRERVQAELGRYLAAFPQDAAYHEVALTGERKPDAASLERAAARSIMVEARPA